MKSPLRSEKLFDKSLVEQSVGGTDDAVTEYAYDHLGRVTSIEQYGVSGGNEVAEKHVEYTYDALGQYATVTTYADLAGADLVSLATYTYDHVGLLTSLVYTQGQTTLASYAYTYDLLGDVLTMTTVDGTTTYTYDHLGQLASTDSTYSADESYTYDETGNRVEANSSTYTTDAENRLLSDGTYTYTYDAEGNRLTRTRIATDAADDYTTEYAWDYRNRLTSVTFKDNDGVVTKTVAYTYDAFNRWIGETISVPGGSTEQTVYVHDGDQIVAQFDKTGAGTLAASDLSHRYAWNSQAVDQLFADERVQYDSQQGKSVTDEVLWTLVDHQNTVRDAVTYDAAADESTIRIHRTFDAYGTMTDEQLYDADGDSVSAGDPGALSELFAYTGRPFDTATQLQNNLNRWYDSTTGRWLSVDPLSFAAGDTNLYRYVGNNSTTYVDPTGLCKDDKSAGVGKAIGDGAVDASSQIKGKRVSPGQSESDAGKRRGLEGNQSQSFRDGKPVRRGENGSSRPEYYANGESVEVKNYTVGDKKGQDNLINKTAKQAKGRVKNLPPGSKQTIIIDVRGQHLTPEQKARIASEIERKSGGAVEKGNVKFLGPKAATIVRGVGRAVTVASFFYDLCSVVTSSNRARTAASVAGGWAGAWGGAEVGAAIGAGIGMWFGGIGAGLGGIIGGIVGGIGGYIAGREAGSNAYDTIAGSR